MAESDHVCFGCSRQIGDHEPHIHVRWGEWSGKQGLAQFGLDDLLTFPFCKPCTVETPDGWQLEAHEVSKERRDG